MGGFFQGKIVNGFLCGLGRVFTQMLLLQLRPDLGQGDGRDFIRELMTVPARINDEEPVESKIVNGAVHGFGRSGRITELKVKSNPDAVFLNHQIEPCAGMGLVKPGLLFAPGQLDDLFESKPLPGKSQAGVRKEFRAVGDAKSCVQQTTIPDIKFG